MRETIEILKNDVGTAADHKVALAEFLAYLKSTLMMKELAGRSNCITTAKLALRKLVLNLNMADLNTHAEVVPFNNCAVYILPTKLIIGNGIVDDYMVHQIGSDYIHDLTQWRLQGSNQHNMVTCNRLLNDLANGDVETLMSLLLYISTAPLNMPPIKKALTFLDDGSCGKSTLMTWLLNAFSNRFECASLYFQNLTVFLEFDYISRI